MDDSAPDTRRPRARVTNMIVAVLAMAFAADQWFEPGGETLTAWIDEAGLSIAAGAAAVMCMVAARRLTGRARAAWLLMAGATGAWAIGEAVWTLFDLVLGLDPFPSVADIFYILGTALSVAAVLALPAAPVGRAARGQAVLDGLLLAASILLISWVVVLHRLFEGSSQGALGLAVSLTYPIGDIATLVVLLFVFARTDAVGRGGLTVLGIGLAANAITDSLFTYLSLVDAYDGGMIDLGFFLAYLLIGCSALTASKGNGHQTRAPAPTARAAAVAIPYGTAVLSIAVRIAAEAAGAGDAFVVFIGSLIVIFVLIRLGLTLADNHALTRHLESKVRARTAELSAREHRFRSLVHNSSDLVTVLDERTTVAYISESLARLFGHEPATTMGSPLTALAHPRDVPQLRSVIADLARRPPGSRAALDFRLRHADGRYRMLEAVATNLLDDPHVEGVVVNGHDITERRQLEDELQRRAFHDSLTGLANRALLRERIQHALIRSPDSVPTALVFLDLDGFKAVNDTYGHSTGDELLVAVAGRLRMRTRPSDTVARLGGDEFAILMEDIKDASEASAFADRVITALAEPFEIGGREIFVAASLGIALRVNGETVEELMRNADLAMYLAKSGSSGYEVFDPSMHDDLQERVSLAHELHGAIARGELEVHYQPVVALRSGEITGVEALLRWNHPSRGFVPPAIFVPIAEESGLIVSLGQWVLREAAQRLAGWRRMNPERDLIVNVNISPRQLLDRQVVPMVQEVLAETGIDPSGLVLEITEGVLLHDSEAMLQQLEDLKRLGVHLAIDDFGTGFSSLSYLQRVPADVLKIDRAFVGRANDGAEESAVARAIVRLGKTFHMRVVAEGVETREQAEALDEMGCDAAQGYLFARPMPWNEIDRLLGASAPAFAAAG